MKKLRLQTLVPQVEKIFPGPQRKFHPPVPWSLWTPTTVPEWAP